MMQGLQTFLLVHVLTSIGQTAHGSDIIHGERAPRNSMQYMASVQTKEGHICGGFLITEDFVVTAAHCAKMNLTHVVLGTHNLKILSQGKILIHKKFKPMFYQNAWRGDDIMLLKLSRKVQLNHKVKIIPLPSAKVYLKENEVCQVAGWGKTEHGTPSNELRVVDVPVIKKKVCKEQWGHLPANVICAGGYGTNTGFCQGDSGGPLVCNGTAVGIVSFNKNHTCNYPHVPNVYTDISRYRQWIDAILKHSKKNT